MQWTEREPDAADLANIAGQGEWFTARAQETEKAGAVVEELLGSIGSAWQGEAAESWKASVRAVVSVLLGCRAAQKLAATAVVELHRELSALRMTMDDVRRTEADWTSILRTNQAVVAEKTHWLSTYHPDDPGTDIFTFFTASSMLADARSTVASATMTLSEAQAERVACVARRRRADAAALADLRAASAALPKEFPAALSSGASVVGTSFTQDLLQATLAGLSIERLLAALKKDAEAPGEKQYRLASLLAQGLPGAGNQVHGISPEAMASLAALTTAPATLGRRQELSKLFATLTTDQATRLAVLFPGLGNIDGVPFTARYAANRVNIAGAIPARVAQMPGLEEALANARKKYDEASAKFDEWVENHPGSEANAFEIPKDFARKELDEATKATKTASDTLLNYKSYLNEKVPSFEIGPNGKKAPDRDGHQILIFSDEGAGSIAEVWGNPATAKNVGIAVPGTKTNMAGFPGASKDQAESFVFEAFGKGQSLAMISWAGGEFPQNIPIVDGGLTPEKSAGDVSFAKELGARLYRFQDAVAAEAPGAKVSAGAHSYGGSTLGEGLRLGMKVDRALYIEAAGLGPGVNSIYDIPHADTTKFYQMTAPGDPISLSQQTGVHGGNPSRDPGIVSLETGFQIELQRPMGKVLSGAESHTDVFKQETTAWQNMYRFYTDMPMEAKAPAGSALKQPSYQATWVDPVTDVPYAEGHSRQDWEREIAIRRSR